MLQMFLSSNGSHVSIHSTHSRLKRFLNTSAICGSKGTRKYENT